MSDLGFKLNYTVFNEIKILIEQSKQQVAVEVNAALSMLYWQIGKRVNHAVLKDQQAEYGKQIIVSLARQLQSEYGNGWSEKQLRHCLRFAEIIPDEKIVSAVQRQLSWTHIKAIILSARYVSLRL